MEALTNMSNVIKNITNECKTAYDLESGYVVTYKGVALWMTLYNENPQLIDGNTIEIVGNEEEGYTILGKTPVIGYDDEFDFSTYGDWETLEDALSWLENPVALY
jgi:hypothetical protein